MRKRRRHRKTSATRYACLFQLRYLAFNFKYFLQLDRIDTGKLTKQRRFVFVHCLLLGFAPSAGASEVGGGCHEKVNSPVCRT